MGCRCGGNGSLNRAIFGNTKSSSSTAQPILAGQARSRRLASIIEQQNKFMTLDRREIQRKREMAILKRQKKIQ